ncbi:MAG: recombination-associated protein RdgC [Thermodesulfobacteriota bacterium]|nr:recombination-associated protein RdgC [Thermodesulfobacteriota bacterium]
MGFIKGTASFVRFSVEGELPENIWDFIADRVVAFSFKDIDETYDEDSLGWVSVLNMFDTEFDYASYAAGNYVTLSMRLDERKISSTIVKKFVQKEEERIKKEKQIAKISRSMRVEIKERIENELMRKALPMPAVFDLCWNLENSTLFFFSTNKKAQALLEDLFKDSFGLTLIQQIPYLCGEHLLDEDDVEKLARITPDVFV